MDTRITYQRGTDGERYWNVGYTVDGAHWRTIPIEIEDRELALEVADSLQSRLADSADAMLARRESR